MWTIIIIVLLVLFSQAVATATADAAVEHRVTHPTTGSGNDQTRKYD